jgi:hypothetical protein
MPLDPPVWFLDRRAEYGIAGSCVCTMARGQTSLPTLPGDCDCAEMQDAKTELGTDYKAPRILASCQALAKPTWPAKQGGVNGAGEDLGVRQVRGRSGTSPQKRKYSAMMRGEICTPLYDQTNHDGGEIDDTQYARRALVVLQ